MRSKTILLSPCHTPAGRRIDARFFNSLDGLINRRVAVGVNEDPRMATRRRNEAWCEGIAWRVFALRIVEIPTTRWQR
jgi:hypothetical protein